MGGLYYEHYMLKLKAGLQRQEKQIVQKKLALQSYARRGVKTLDQPHIDSDDKMLSLKIRQVPPGKDISLSLDGQRRLPGLSSSLKAFKDYTRSLENKTEDDL